MIRLFLLGSLTLSLVSCATHEVTVRRPLANPTSPTPSLVKKGATFYTKVKTTAYCHKEADSRKYGKGSGVGGILQYGPVRSAAADWSVFPVGTTFKVAGMPNALFCVDDYGSALVGTQTVDIYQPTLTKMNAWGNPRHVLEIVKWGSFEKSLAILKPRANVPHVRTMVTNIKRKMDIITVAREYDKRH